MADPIAVNTIRTFVPPSTEVGLFGCFHLYDLRPKPKPCLAVRNRQEHTDA
jgi:hypothetical protein